MSFKGDEVVLRPLSSLESVLDINQEKCKNLLSFCFQVDSNIDLIKNKCKVLSAIKKWTGLHPLLNVKIIKQKLNVNGVEIRKRYFALASSDLIDSLGNVLFLRFEGSTQNDDYWLLLLENEFTIPVDAANGPLWRLKFVEVDIGTDPIVFKYCVYLTIHHAVVDGSNAYEIVNELFKIIEYEDENLQLEIDSRRQNLIELEKSYPNDPRIIMKPENIDTNVPAEPVIGLIIPDYLKVNKEIESSLCASTNDGLFRDTTDSVYITLNDILKKREFNFTRFKILKIKSETFTRALQKCKQMKAKFTGFLEIVVALAFQNVYRHFSKDDENFVKVHYNVTINQRPHLEPPLDTIVMGAWLIGYLTSFEGNYDIQDKLFFKSTFWNLIQKQYAGLHTFISEKSFFKKKTVEMIENSIYKLESGYKVKDCSFHYTISNMGAVGACANESLGKIAIKASYSGQSFTRDEFRRHALHSIQSIGDSLYWNIVYNGSMLSEDTLNYWIKCIMDIVELVSNDNS